VLIGAPVGAASAGRAAVSAAAAAAAVAPEPEKMAANEIHGHASGHKLSHRSGPERSLTPECARADKCAQG